MKVSVKSTDHGAKKRLAAIKGLNCVVSVGIHGGEGGAASKDGDGMTVSEVAAIHEFGLGVPKRSWLREFVDNNRTDLLRMLSASSKQVAAGKLTPEIAMHRFGLAVTGMMKKRIVEGISPPLKDSTKKAKLRITGGPKDTPLILWGQLLSSILHELKANRP